MNDRLGSDTTERIGSIGPSSEALGPTSPTTTLQRPVRPQDKAGFLAKLDLPGLMDRIPDRLKPKMPDLKSLIGPLLLGLVVVLLISYSFILKALGPDTVGREITLTELSKRAQQGAVESATFMEEDSNLVVRIVPQPPAAPAPVPGELQAPPPPVTENPFWAWTAYPSSDAETSTLIERMADSGAEVKIDHQVSKVRLRFIAQFLFPLLILAALFSFFFLLITGQAGGAGDFLGFSKFAAKVQRKRKGQMTTTFKDVAAIDEGITELREVVDYLQNPQRYADLGARAPKGVLLAGPPGTGKTLLAKAVAGEASVPFIQLSGSEFVESLVGVGAARVRDLFKQARAMAPCIIFIDELDAAGRQRGAGMGQGNDEREQTLNQLLVEMDGFSAALGIAVLGATNRPDILDPALLRPGRFDRQVVIDVPDVRGREEILKVHARGRPLAPDCDLQQIAKECPGFTGAELANILNEAALLAVRADQQLIGQDHLEEAVDRVISGPERKSHLLTEDEKVLIAYHEAGHAIVARGVGQEEGVLKLSIVARGLQLGHASTYSSADRLIMLRSELEAQITLFLGGLAAEKLLFGEISTGNTKDLERATTLARKLVATYGMNDALGRMQVIHEGQVFMGRDFGAMQNIGPNTLNLMDKEIHQVLHQGEERALAICELNRQVMDDIVKVLLERETMAGPELEPYMDRVKRLELPKPISAVVGRDTNGGQRRRRTRKPQARVPLAD